jgi:UDP-glucose 4-epimerase
MRVAILGGAGFIGTNLAVELTKNPLNQVYVYDRNPFRYEFEDKNRVQFVQGDLNDYLALKKFINSSAADTIFHLAANSDIKNSAISSEADLQDTLMTTVNIASVIQGSRVKELVFASSSAVYGQHDVPISENFPCRPESAYGWMKLASERILLNLQGIGAVEKLLIARFPNVTGKFQTHGVVYDLVNRLRVNSQLLEVLGDGTQLKPYLSAENLSKTLIRIINLPWSGNMCINIAPPDQITVRNIAEIIVDSSTVIPKLEFQQSRAGWKGDIPQYKLSTDKLESLFPDLIFPSSREAIIEAVSWKIQESQ